jgi:hypothetical protein
MAQRPTEKLPARNQRSSLINRYSAAVRKCRELYGESLAAILGNLDGNDMVAARPHGPVVPYGNAIARADSTFASNWAKLREEGNLAR